MAVDSLSLGRVEQEARLLKIPHNQMWIHTHVCLHIISELCVSTSTKKGVRAADSSVLLSSNLKIPVILHTALLQIVVWRGVTSSLFSSHVSDQA